MAEYQNPDKRPDKRGRKREKKFRQHRDQLKIRRWGQITVIVDLDANPIHCEISNRHLANAHLRDSITSWVIREIEHHGIQDLDPMDIRDCLWG